MPFPQHNINQRLNQAKENLNKAPSGLKIFLGIEHLPYLPDNTTNIIIVEKSKELCENYRASHAEIFNRLADSIVVGEWGIVPEKIVQHYFLPTLLRIETAVILLKLFDLLVNSSGPVTVLSVWAEPSEKLFDEQIREGVRQIILARDFHREHATTYTQCREQLKSRLSQVKLVLNNVHAYATRRALGEFYLELPKDEYISHEIPYRFVSDHVPFFPIELHPEISSRPASQDSIGRENALALLGGILEHKPQAVMQINHGMLSHIIDIFFLQHMLRLLEIPVYSMFSDFFQHQSVFIVGGLTHDVQSEYKTARNNNDKTITMHPFSAGLYSYDEPVYHVPCHAVRESGTFSAPVTDAGQIKRDVLIVHTTRNFATHITEFNELYEIITAHTTVRHDKAALYLLQQLRSNLSTRTDLVNSYYIKNSLNLLEWIFYCQARIRMVIEVTTRCLKKGNLSIAVHGDGWGEYLPKEICGPIVHPDELKILQQESLITLDLSTFYALDTPHPPVFHCLQNGGLPLTLSPCFDDKPSAYFNQIDTSQFLYFDSVTACFEMIRTIKNNFSKRAGYITTMQNKIKTALGDKKIPTLESWLNKPTSKTKLNLSTPPFTGETEEILGQVALGYVYSQSGLVKLAAQTWGSLVFEKNFKDQTLITRLYKTYTELGDTVNAEKTRTLTC